MASKRENKPAAACRNGGVFSPRLDPMNEN